MRQLISLSSTPVHEASIWVLQRDWGSIPLVTLLTFTGPPPHQPQGAAADAACCRAQRGREAASGKGEEEAPRGNHTQGWPCPCEDSLPTQGAHAAAAVHAHTLSVPKCMPATLRTAELTPC